MRVARQPKRQPLDPRVTYQAVNKDWDWTDSKWAESLMTYAHHDRGDAEWSRELSRRSGVNHERIIRITTSIEIVDEGNEDLISYPRGTRGWYAGQRDTPTTEDQQ